MKVMIQGLGYGYYDKFGFFYYDNGDEVVVDYGVVCFFNVEFKFGGRYLFENEIWVKQIVVYNVLVVDQISYFNGDWCEGQKYVLSVIVFEEVDGV